MTFVSCLLQSATAGCSRGGMPHGSRGRSPPHERCYDGSRRLSHHYKATRRCQPNIAAARLTSRFPAAIVVNAFVVTLHARRGPPAILLTVSLACVVAPFSSPYRLDDTSAGSHRMVTLTTHRTSDVLSAEETGMLQMVEVSLGFWLATFCSCCGRL